MTIQQKVDMLRVLVSELECHVGATTGAIDEAEIDDVERIIGEIKQVVS